MTVNVNSPNGFQKWGRQEGGSPTAGLSTSLVASDDTTPIGYGDPVTQLSTGYVTRTTAGTTQIHGIFYGCEYLSPAVGRRVWSNNWPGSGNSGDILAYIDTDPDGLFQVQALSTAVTFADIGANIQVNIGTPNTVTGMSTSSVTTPNTTNTLPFRIVALLSQFLPANSVPGTDDASNYNRIIVAPNLWDRSSPLGI